MLIQIIFVKKDFDFKKILKLTKNYLISSFIMFGICILISNLVKNNMLSMLCQIILGSITYFSILLLLKDEICLEIISKSKK